jgi:hypothetical protein
MKLLGSIEPSLVAKHFMVDRGIAPRRPQFSDISSDSFVSNDAAHLDDLRLLLKEHGFRERKAHFSYAKPAVNRIIGSVGGHIDDGLGLTALWLLRLQELPDAEYHYGLEACLFGKRNCFEMAEGDVAIFNANAIHGWACNCIAYAITLPIARIRKRKP